ncbi:MAG TPA: dienelactone hydrolase family protein [Gemmatimonadaceae bacterium]|nr:dienelactone hydrolase family protein [Gemmatimonadaceae bacterium]
MLRRVFAVCALVSACSLQRVPPSAQSQAALLDDHMAHMSAADMRLPAITPSRQQGDLKLPPSANTAPARIKASPRHGEWVKIAVEPGSKDTLEAWVVYPMSRDKAPVVVVVHEIFGLQTWVRGVADQVAAEGFIAIAPDFFSRPRGGPSTDELPGDSATKLQGMVPITERNKIINAAASYAMMLPSAQQKYAVIGYCWGGQTVWGHAVSNGVKGYSGGVAFYGAFPFTVGGQRATATAPAVPASLAADSMAKIQKPVMLLSGSRDARIGATMPAIDSMMKAMKKDYYGMNYEGAIHGFLRAQDDPASGNNAGTEAANLAATKDAWPKTVAFLKKNLK